MNIEQSCDRAARARRHAALSDVMRLAVVDALALGDHSPGELQTRLGLSSNLLAHHLKVLQDAGIVARRRSEGDRRRTYLTLTDRTAVETVAAVDAGRVVFVCTANSARSQLAAAMWAGLTDVPVASAGTRPADQVAPGAVAVAERRGLRLLGQAPQQLADVTGDHDLVVAVCDNAYEEHTGAVDVHWSVPDPVRIGGDQAFETVYDELSRRVLTLSESVRVS
jgi:protein-tyrosine-phosphatase